MTAMTTDGQRASARRAELAAFLRSRRERISPEQVGLPPGARRRTPGLRREEVAQLAGVGVTWYTWLEQGRQINASAQVLGAVARTLRLDQAERRAPVPAGRRRRTRPARPGHGERAASRCRRTSSGIMDAWCRSRPRAERAVSTCSAGTRRTPRCGPG